MHIREVIKQLHPAIADAVKDATPGFRFATGEGEPAFGQSTGDGEVWRDVAGSLELKRGIDVTPTGLVVCCRMTNLSANASVSLSTVEPVCIEFAVGRQDWVHYHAKGGDDKVRLGCGFKSPYLIGPGETLSRPRNGTRSRSGASPGGNST